MIEKKKKLNLYFIYSILFFYFELINFIYSFHNSSVQLFQDNNSTLYTKDLNSTKTLRLLDDSIISGQLLTNIIEIGTVNFRYINFALNLKGDMIILSTAKPGSCERIFYGLKKNGRYYFKDGEIETPYYIKNITGEEDNNQRFEAETLFIQLSNNDTDINGKEYYLSIGKYKNYVELFDFENDNYSFIQTTTFFETLINSYVNSFFKLSKSDDNYYYIVTGIGSGSIFHIKKYSFYSNDIKQGYTSHNSTNYNVSDRFISSCFETEKHLILCFIQDLLFNFNNLVYDEDLNQLYERIIFDEDNSKGSNNQKIFFKGIHFKGEIGVFAYYPSFNYTSPLITFIKAENEASLVEYNNFANITLDNVSSYYYLGLNDIIKIDNNTICYSSISLDKKVLNIIFLKIYGENDSKLSMSIYSVNTYTLQNYIFYQDLKIFSYNNFICLASSYCLGEKCEEKDSHYTSLIIFSYSNSSDSYFELFNYLSQNSENINNLCFNLENKTFIENNIFGFIFDGIIITNFPNNINLVSCQTNKSIDKNYILQKNEEFRISLNNIEENYLIEFSLVLTEPSYETMNKLIVNYNEKYFEKKEDYDKLKNKYIGKTSYFKINGTDKISLGCEDELCDLCMSNNRKKCISCKYNGYYDKKNLEKICFDSDTSSFICPNQIILEGNCHEYIYSQQIKEIYQILKSQILNGDYQNNKIIIYTKNVVFQISTLEEQKFSNFLNVSNVDLRECEKRLKKKEGLSENDNLIIFKIDIKNEDLSSTYVQYEIFNNYTLKQLNLSICNDIKIQINAPIYLNNNIEILYENLSELGYNLFDPNDSFYNDICSTYTSEYGTDVLLSDRRNSLYYYNSLCQENCQFVFYNSTTKKSICECSVQEEETITDINEIEFNKTLLINSFYTTLSNSNFKVLKCFKLVLSLKGQINNMGSYILILISLTIIILMIIYYIYDYKKINEFILKILKMKNDPEQKKVIFNKKIEKNEDKSIEKKNINEIESFEEIMKKQHYPPKRKKIKKKSTKKGSSHDIRNILIKSPNEDNYIINEENKEKKMLNINKSKITTNKLNIDKILKIEDNNNELLNEQELNNLEYENALKYDKRDFFRYYISIIKHKHTIIFTFFISNDYNLITIKLSLFLVSFSLYFVINGFFFSDDTMHKIYEDKGSSKFIYQMPQIIYSSVVSLVINTILKILSLSQSSFLKLKKENDLNTARNKAQDINKCLKIKFLIFFIFSFLLMVFFWYYISCFCAVYNNTQIILIKDTFISYGISMIYPFFINLIPGFFRIVSLKAKNKEKKCLYNLSLLIS